jgi:outer membrane lipoprotein-sorting protein
LVVVAALATATTTCHAQQNGFRQPVHRVANQPERPESQAALPKALPDGQTFDLQQRPGEHPLAPVLRVAKAGLAEIDAKIQDYSCIVTKEEAINGVLGESQTMFVRVRHQPYSVYMYFLQPFKGREVLYVDGKYNGKLVAMSDGLLRSMGRVKLNIHGDMAMKGQKYPITKFGIRTLTAELIQVAEQDVKFGECSVNVRHNAAIDKRPCTRIEVIHPTPRKNFRFHIARIYIDNELRIPVRYGSWMWPRQPGEKPPLEEQYTYRRIKLNNGYDDSTFDEDNPEIFKR